MALKPFSGTTQREKDALETRFGIDQEVFKVAVEAAATALKSKATRGY